MTLLPIPKYSSKALLAEGSQKICPLPHLPNRHSSPTHPPPACRSCHAAGCNSKGRGPLPGGGSEKGGVSKRFNLLPSVPHATPLPPKTGTAPPFLFWGGRAGALARKGVKGNGDYHLYGGSGCCPPSYPFSRSAPPLQTAPPTFSGSPPPCC